VIERSADPPELPRLLARARSAGLVLDLFNTAPDARGRWRNRTFRLHPQAALWGGVDVVRTWGRRGSLRRPRRLVTHHPYEVEAADALASVIRRRLRRDYSLARP
jgi:hypothetical protein